MGLSLSDPAVITADLSNLMRDSSHLLFLPGAFSSKYLSFANSITKVLSNNLAKSMFQLRFVIIFKRSLPKLIFLICMAKA